MLGLCQLLRARWHWLREIWRKLLANSQRNHPCSTSATKILLCKPNIATSLTAFFLNHKKIPPNEFFFFWLAEKLQPVYKITVFIRSYTRHFAVLQRNNLMKDHFNRRKGGCGISNLRCFPDLAQQSLLNWLRFSNICMLSEGWMDDQPPLSIRLDRK